MAKLEIFSENSFDILARSRLKSVEAGKIYYLHNGRNAWHSTWVHQYQDGCMHSSIGTAKIQAERLRVQGSVFYIVELPTIICRSAKGVIAVTQINTASPLAGYSVDAVHPEPLLKARKVKGARDCYFGKGAPMLGVALSFHVSSRFWRQRPPPRNSVFVLASNDPELPFERLKTGPLGAQKSTSFGPDYHLGWLAQEGRYSGHQTRPLRNIAVMV